MQCMAEVWFSFIQYSQSKAMLMLIYSYHVPYFVGSTSEYIPFFVVCLVNAP
jgi:hypothetical protein